MDAEKGIIQTFTTNFKPVNRIQGYNRMASKEI